MTIADDERDVAAFRARELEEMRAVAAAEAFEFGEAFRRLDDI